MSVLELFSEIKIFLYCVNVFAPLCNVGYPVSEERKSNHSSSISLWIAIVRVRVREWLNTLTDVTYFILPSLEPKSRGNFHPLTNLFNCFSGVVFVVEKFTFLSLQHNLINKTFCTKCSILIRIIEDNQ